VPPGGRLRIRDGRSFARLSRESKIRCHASQFGWPDAGHASQCGGIAKGSGPGTFLDDAASETGPDSRKALELLCRGSIHIDALTPGQRAGKAHQTIASCERGRRTRGAEQPHLARRLAGIGRDHAHQMTAKPKAKEEQHCAMFRGHPANVGRNRRRAAPK